MQLAQVLGAITRHPLNRGRPLQAVVRFARWQLRSRLARAPIRVPWVKDIEMWVRRGETGLTGNIYCGLVEFCDMAFVLHFLQKDDLLMDIGSNAGAYTLLGSRGAGARVIAVEPHPETFERLLANVHLNEVDARVEAHQKAIGASSGQVTLSDGLDVTNRVLEQGEQAPGVAVSMTTVDALVQEAALGPPLLMKVDVEGFEWAVLDGAEHTLHSVGLQALIIESAGHGERYGHGDEELHQHILAAGFTAMDYDPAKRSLTPRETMAPKWNTLYVKDAAAAEERVKSAPAFDVLGRRF